MTVNKNPFRWYIPSIPLWNSTRQSFIKSSITGFIQFWNFDRMHLTKSFGLKTSFQLNTIAANQMFHIESQSETRAPIWKFTWVHYNFVIVKLQAWRMATLPILILDLWFVDFEYFSSQKFRSTAQIVLILNDNPILTRFSIKEFFKISFVVEPKKLCRDPYQRNPRFVRVGRCQSVERPNLDRLLCP